MNRSVRILLIITLALITAILFFALSSSAETILYGDVNNDGKVDGKDVVRLKNYLANFDFDTGTSSVKLGPEHVVEEWTITVPPTCTEAGERQGVCTDCGQTVTETLPPTGHTAAFDKAKEPTCTETGLSEGSHCSVCGEVLTAQEILPIIPHNYVNGVCTICANRLPSEGLEFTLNDDGESYSVTGIGTCTDTEVVIPDTYNGKPVTLIGSYAFSGCSSLTIVAIPDSVTSSIGEDTFSYCSSLTSVTIPDSVTSIGARAFRGCSSLTNVMIPDSVTMIGKDAFNGCTSLANVTISASVSSIDARTFNNCTNLINVTIPDSVTTIGEHAFNNCTSLSKVTIGSSVTEIGFSAFNYCISLTSVTVPDSVIKIDNVAFSSCTNLKSVTIPNSVTSIGAGAFQYCANLTSMIISDSVTTIGSEAFYGCANLKTVYYTGTQAQWKSIRWYSNDYLTNATIINNYQK